MTVKEFYEKIGGDYPGINQRIQSDEKIKKYLLMLLNDDSFNKLSSALKENNYSDAFLAAHSLKGVAQNLSLDRLAEKDSELTEVLRNKVANENIDPLYKEVEVIYLEVIKNIKEL